MEINALMMDVTDNVVTCVADVPKGAEVVYRKGDEICSLTAEENIPYCHKIALGNLLVALSTVYLILPSKILAGGSSGVGLIFSYLFL